MFKFFDFKPSKMFFHRLAFCFALGTLPLWGANYQVGAGKDYARLQDVTDLLQPGDTVFVDGNATYEGGVTFENAGSDQAPIVIQGLRVDGKRPVLSGGTNTVHFSSPWPYDKGADHYVFQGFEITGGSSRCVFHQAGNLTLRDLWVRDCPKQGILGADVGSGSVLIEFVEVSHCGGGNPDRDHQIYMATDEVNRPGSVFRMQHCYLHDGDGGNNVKSRSERNEIYYNWIEGAHYHELELIGPDPGGADEGWTPELKREDSDVVGNVMWKKGDNANFSVMRFGGDATGESHGRYRFVNNTVLSGTGAVFRLFDALESVEAHNNVFYTIGGSINLVREVEAVWSSGSKVFTGSNNWVLSGAANIPPAWTGTLTGADPMFMDLAANDLRPQEGSPLENAGNSAPMSPSGREFDNPHFPPQASPANDLTGTSVLTRPNDNTPDIGAFESDGTSGLGQELAIPAPHSEVRWQWDGSRLQVRVKQSDGWVTYGFEGAVR